MFEYTDHKQVESSALTDLYYNADENKLAVVTHDGNVYVYGDVATVVFNYLANAPSVGNYYATVIKRYYGPSTSLGQAHRVEFVNTGEKATVGTPKGLTYADDAVVTSIDNPAAYVTLGEPYTYGNTSTTSINYNGLGATRRHEVVFTIEGLEGERTTSVSGISLNDAVENVKSSLRAFGLTIKVVRVVTHFE